MIRRSYRNVRTNRKISSRDYSRLKNHEEFEYICETIQEKLKSSEFRDAVKLIDKVLANKASEDEIEMLCDLIGRIGIFGRTLLNQSDHLKELEVRLPSKTASLRRRF